MCGIFAFISSDEIDVEAIKLESDKLSARGPDSSKEISMKIGDKNIYLAFHRLAINGLDEKSDQPMNLLNLKSIYLLCNGEIYNYKSLAKKYKIDLETNSDCEIIIHLYNKLPVDKFIRELDGVFSFVICDKDKQMILIGHDPIGVRPLYWYHTGRELALSSEMKGLSSLNNSIDFYPPGSYSYYKMGQIMKSLNTYSYYTFDYPLKEQLTEERIIPLIQEKLEESVKKRLITDRPFGCLLSGGLDSSIIVSILVKLMGKESVRTFAIGLENSPDLLAAQKAADYLGTNHTNVIVSEEEMIQSIEDTIYQIESYDTTTVRASVPMFLLAKYIRDNTDIKVIFSGEGSDEASGSYLYFHNAPTPEDFQAECIRLLKDVRYFDVLRGDKTIAGAGLELRVPFFDKDFLRFYMSINPSLKMVRNGFEKYLLRKSYEDYLPQEIAWRRKDGFSDGVSVLDRPWYKIIEEYSKLNYGFTEKQLYEMYYKKYYNKCMDIIPYQWMPKWTEGVGENPSGRLIIN